MRTATVATVLLVTATSWAQTDPCAREREEKRKAEERMRAPFGQYARDEYARVASALSACESHARQGQAAAERAQRDLERREQDRRDIEARARKEEERIAAQKVADESVAKAQAEDEAAYDKIKANKKLMSAIFGAGFCLIRRYRDNALKEIATQRKYSRIGGVQNNVQLLTLQNAVRRADELEKKERTELKGFKGVTPMTCAKPEVVLLMMCRTTEDEPPPEPCREEPIPRMVSLVTDPRSSDDE